MAYEWMDEMACRWMRTVMMLDIHPDSLWLIMAQHWRADGRSFFLDGRSKPEQETRISRH
jgi:hypothetical protein